jgi:cyclopropane-fatty-acyl-phospholipid synthase
MALGIAPGPAGVAPEHPAGPAGPAPREAVVATDQHYSLPPAFFAAFLDTRLKYSSGLYRGDVGLDTAQTDKLHFVAAQLGLGGGERLLDVGCGWGSLVLFMAQEYGCEVTGVTPSATQASYVRDRAREAGVAQRVDVRVGPFMDVAVDGRYQAVTMLGSIVHMPDRVAVLDKAYACLRRHGRLYLSESAFRNSAVYREFGERPGTRHVTETVFGFADMVPFSTLVGAVESAGFSLDSLHDLTVHYRRTIDDWQRRAEANRDRIEEVAPGMFAPLTRYLQTANAGWGYTTKHYALTASRSRFGASVMAG